MMKEINYKTIGVILLLLFTGLSNVYSQQTAYEKKVSEITEKYFSICYYGYNKTLTMSEKAELQMYTSGDEAREFILGLGILNYAMNHTEAEVKKLVTQIDIELKAAEKLKTSVDFQREKEREEKKRQKAYEKTDAGNIFKNIKNSFAEWNTKGEFEKEADYKERLKNQSIMSFQKICIEQINNRINEYSIRYDLDKELSTYNSENESFLVLFKFNGLESETKINIPIANAPDFKNEWRNLNTKVGDYDWCFVNDSLCPTMITMYNNNDKYEFNLSYNNKENIDFSFDDFEIDNSYLKGYTFKYADGKIIEQKIYQNYIKQLDSTFNAYNQKLLQNPYNTGKSVMEDYQKMKEEGNKSKNYENSLRNLESQFEKLNSSFEKNMMSQNPSEYCKIFYSLNPEKKIEADSMYIECWCNYSQRSNFDIRFIKGNLYNCNCREQEYRKNGNLFTNKDEFNLFYNKGIEVLQEEIEVRKFTSQTSVIESLNFKDLNKSGAGRALMSDLSGYNVNQNIELEKKWVQLIASHKGKSSYPRIIEFVVNTNKVLSKEWEKNGTYFKDKIEFYEAYISPDYKKILKGKK